MTFDQLEQIGRGLYGTSWQAQLARALNIDKRNVQHWKKQGVAKWVKPELWRVIEMRKAEVLMSEQVYLTLKTK